MPYDVMTLGDLQQGIDKSKDSWLIDPRSWDIAEDVFLNRGIVHKRTGTSVYGQMGVRQYGVKFQKIDGVYSQTNTGQCKFFPVIPKSFILTCGALTVRDDGIPVDNGSGELVGNLIGDIAVDPLWNTINYTTGAFKVKFSALPIADTYSDYHYEVDQYTRGLKTYYKNSSSVELIGWNSKRVSRYDTDDGVALSYFYNIPKYQELAITGITKANPGKVTVASTAGWTNGDTVLIRDVVGMKEVNNRLFTIAVTSPTEFTIGVDTSGYTAYGSGGVVFNTAPSLYVYGDIWNSTDLMWSENFFQMLWMVDNSVLPGSGIAYYDGLALVQPKLYITSTNTLHSSKMLIAYHESLVALNTVEKEGANYVRYKQRARWHRPPNPFAADVWRDDIPGKGNYNDAPTDGEIIGAAFIKDTLVVQFTTGYWALVYTANPISRFIWRQITPKGSTRSTFGTVAFEGAIMGIGLEGIQGCDGNRVIKIDEKIPEFIYDIDLENIKTCFSFTIDRLHQTWIAYPPAPNSAINTKVLVLNEGEQSYTRYNLSLTCMEAWHNSFDKTFNSFTGKTFNDLKGMTWGSQRYQTDSPIILGGGFKGYVYEIDDEDNEVDSITWLPSDALPIGFDVKSPNLNPYKDQGKKACLHWVKLYFKKETVGKVTVEFYRDDFGDPGLQREIDLTKGEGNKCWFTLSVNQTANFHSMRIYLSEGLMESEDNYRNSLEFHGAQFAFSPAGDFTL